MRLFLPLVLVLGLVSAATEAWSSGLLYDLKTQKNIAASDLKKKPMVLVFWASWCQNCSENLAAVQKLFSQDLLEKHVRGISVDEEPSAALAYLNKKPHLSFFRDYSFLDKGGAFAEEIKLEGLPGIALIDDQGQVVWRFQGVLDEKQQADLLKRFKAMVKT